jgi:RimJ/RimL family protein N-acetyltransferase
MIELATDRLILRPHGLADVADCTAMWGDPEVTRYIGTGLPSPPADVWARVLRYAGHWALSGYGFWAARARSTGRFVGDVGLMDFRRGMVAETPGLSLDEPECGWVLAAWAHGRGYATEAMRAVTAWAETRFPRVMCIIDPDNQGSVRVAHKLGFAATGVALLAGDPVHVFHRSRS